MKINKRKCNPTKSKLIGVQIIIITGDTSYPKKVCNIFPFYSFSAAVPFWNKKLISHLSYLIISAAFILAFHFYQAYVCFISIIFNTHITQQCYYHININFKDAIILAYHARARIVRIRKPQAYGTRDDWHASSHTLFALLWAFLRTWV